MDAEDFLASLCDFARNFGATISYVSPKPKGVFEEDKVIGSYKLDVASADIVPVDSLFER